MKRTEGIDQPLYSRIRALISIATVDSLVLYKGHLLLMLINNKPARDQ